MPVLMLAPLRVIQLVFPSVEEAVENTKLGYFTKYRQL